jgi:hypothetical protein
MVSEVFPNTTVPFEGGPDTPLVPAKAGTQLSSKSRLGGIERRGDMSYEYFPNIVFAVPMVIHE